MSKEALKRIKENMQSRAKELNLQDCNLESLPAELGECVWLEELDISENKNLSQITLLSKLINIKKLTCVNTNIEDLYPISKLTHLIYLNISGSMVSDLSVISNLTTLEELGLTRTPLRSLTTISKLINLRNIWFIDTQIHDLSPLSNLSSIQKLWFIETKVSDLLPISQLPNLRVMGGSSTLVTDLSPILPFIKDGTKITTDDNFPNNELRDFSFANCPLTNPPYEIVKQGNEAILKYFEEKEKQGEEKLYEAKIVVVGAGESGKTTLIKKLLNPAHPVPNPEDKRTEGIKVTPYPFKGLVKGVEKDLTAYLWDFGGQELYHATHQFFLTPDTLYVLLNDNRKNDTDFYYWLNIVRLRAGDRCPILTVFNAKDKSPRQIVPGDELYEAFPGVVKQALDIDFADKNLQVFDQLKEDVESHFTHLEVLGKPYPRLWVQARETLGTEQAEKITWTRFEEICRSQGVNDEDSMRILARTLHNLGVLLYFPEVFGLEDLVILQPQWCIDAIYKAFDLEAVVKNQGKFSEKTLADCWRHDPRFNAYSLQLLKLMQQFDLCYPVEGARDEYIAPQLLPLEENRLPDFPGRNAIHVRFEYTFMPAGMLTSLIARMSRHIRIPHVWRTGVTLEWEEGTLAEVTEQSFSRQINIKVVGPERQRRLSDIRKNLLDIHQRFRGLKYAETVACPCSDCADKAGATMFEMNELEDNALHGDDMICRNGTRKRKSAKQILEGLAFTDNTRIFISYAHKNESLKDEFREMINPLERKGDWKVWDDCYLLANDDWNGEIIRHLSEANVIVLLLTPAFFKSNYIYDIEFSRALQRHEAGDALLIGVVVEDCMWEETPLRKIQVVPKDAKPVIQHPHRSEVWKSVAKKIQEAVLAREARDRRQVW